ncbi:MAG TPA: hypothetical protein VKU38_04415 [Ktedonobacteraceae bacterium]|nr:hypothetical protein [Ktedonobacteraceae bacterium]
MWRYVIGVLLIVHGLIVGAQSFGDFGGRPGVGVANPSWLSWWPTNLGQSWLLTRLGIEYGPAFWLAGLLWLVAMICLIAAGFGVMGVLVPHAWWPMLPVAGAAISLCLLLLFFHPFFVLGALVDVGMLIALLWADFPSQVLVS